MTTEPVDWAGRTFGELSPDEQRRAAQDAGRRLGAELQANAGAISAVMDGRPTPAWRRELNDESKCTCHAPQMRHDMWRIDNPAGDGKNRLITDFAIRTYGRSHIEKLLARVGCPPLPEAAWEVLP